jgi:triacylglycerol lipase
VSNLKPKPIPTDYSFENLFAPNTEYKYFENSSDHPFRFASNKFQMVNAWWLAEASLLAYVRDDDFVRNSLAGAGLYNVEFFKKEGTQSFVAHNTDFIVVCFRGTEVDDVQDIVTDAKFILVDSEQGGKVHMGFKDAVDLVWEDMKEYIENIKSDSGSGQTVWFTGHSLGAALAVIAADRYGDVHGVYTFGSPRAVDEDFVDDYYACTYRFTNNNDIVTMIPPPILYRHVGMVKYIDGKGHIHDNPQKWYKKIDQFNGHFSHFINVLGSWRTGAFDSIPSDNINDHAPIYYVVKIWNNYIKDVKS